MSMRPAMDHDGARRLMAEGVEGRLSSHDERELALHLVSCPECKRLYEGLQHAQPALAAIGSSHPPTRAVDTAVRRATTVLRGDADPGPLGRSTAAVPPAPTAPPEAPKPTWAQTTGPLLPPDAVEEEKAAEEGQESEEDKPAPTEAPFLEASITDADEHAAPTPTEPRQPPLPEAVVSPKPAAVSEEDAARPAPGPLEPPPPPPRPAERPSRPAPPPAAPAPPRRSEAEAGTRPPPPPPRRSEAEPATGEPMVPEAIPVVPAPTRVSSGTASPPPKVDEVEALFDEDYAETIAPPRRARPERREAPRPGPLLAALSVALALAALVFVLLTRGQGLIGAGGDLPTEEEVRSRIVRVFADMKSLKTSVSIRKLSLFRTGAAEGSLVYNFANGRYSGRFVYDRAEGYRQEITLRVNEREVERAKVVQTDAETRSLLGAGANAQLLVEKRPPLGPPDGQLRPNLGLLDDSIAAVAGIIASADDLEVVGRSSADDRELYHVRATVTPDELTRADQIEAFLDTRSFFPVIIRRSISKVDAGVLGPPDVLTDEAISTAFGDRERITTELVELENYVIDDIVLPGDFVLDVPAGSQPQERDSQFERVPRVQLAGRLPFKPLFPRSMPEGFQERSHAVYIGEQRGWGQGGRFPAPDGVLHSAYFDGRTTIVVTQRNIPSGPFNLDGSPLQTSGLPITVRPFERAEKRFFYGVSPEVPPHAYGFLGNVFALVVGYAPADQLIDTLASLAEAPAEVPAAPASPGVSPPPGATPSPGASPTPSPTASP